MPEALDPSWIAAQSSLIVRARVRAREPARYVLRHPSVGLRGPGSYAWHDFTFEVRETVWRDTELPQPGPSIRVRVYDAKTPVVNSSVEGEPDFIPGEEYVLCLTEMDGRAFLAGPPHWRAVGGAHGAFLLRDGAVMRKTVDEKPFISLSALLASLASADRDEDKIAPAREYRKRSLEKGIRTVPGPVRLRRREPFRPAAIFSLERMRG
jgi:hypothetical protein